MKIIYLSIILLFLLAPCSAQNSYNIPNCNFASGTENLLGNRFKLTLPADVVKKTGNDADYSAYSIRYGKKKSAFWMNGIFGPNATSGLVPESYLTGSTEVSNRVFKAGNFGGVDAKGKLSNGNYWRYFGQFGEAIRYYDVPADAADYFDKIINTACYNNK